MLVHFDLIKIDSKVVSFFFYKKKKKAPFMYNKALTFYQCSTSSAPWPSLPPPSRVIDLISGKNKNILPAFLHGFRKFILRDSVRHAF